MNTLSSEAPLTVTVVVPSHDREARLRLLLEGLKDQTLSRDQWEVVVVHTYPPDVAAGILEGHELARAGVLRSVPVGADGARAARQRNIGWREARGRLIAFTDDDCRPVPSWLERLVARYEDEPGTIVQGATRPDPREEHLFVHPHIRTLHIEPPDRYTQTCNVLYERELLERVGGFDERIVTGEDVDLALRARDGGARVVAAPDALTYHAIDALSLIGKIRSQHKWQHLAYLVKRHPELRRYCEWGVWYKREHLRAALALVALLGAPRHRWMLLGTVPYIRLERWRHGPAKRAQLRAIREIPSHWVIELAEIGTFVLGSLRYRTFLL